MNQPLRAALAALLAAFSGASVLAQSPPACPPAAQAPSPERIRSAMRDARDHGFLWRISKNGRSSWLFGTLHVAKFDWMFPGPEVGKALNASRVIALEMDLLDPEIMRRMTQGMAVSAGAALPEALQQRLLRQADAECFARPALAAMLPEMQVATLTTLVGRRDELDPAYGIDIFLAGWGHGTQRPVVSLETPELQLKLLQMTSPAETIEYVQSALDDLESGRAQPALRQIAQVWADGDWNALRDYATWCDCLKTPADRAAMTRLLDERNPALAEAIDALHAGGKTVFAAVGSLHMIGTTGLPTLMAARGYRVERIVYPQKPQETTP